MVGIKGNRKKLSEEAENSDEEESENQGLAFDLVNLLSIWTGGQD